MALSTCKSHPFIPLLIINFMSYTLVRLKENRRSPGNLRYWCLMRHAEKWAHNSISKGRTSVIPLQSPRQAVSLQGRECLHLCRPRQLAHPNYGLPVVYLVFVMFVIRNECLLSLFQFCSRSKKSIKISKSKDKTKFVMLYMSRNRAYP